MTEIEALVRDTFALRKDDVGDVPDLAPKALKLSVLRRRRSLVVASGSTLLLVAAVAMVMSAVVLQGNDANGKSRRSAQALTTRMTTGGAVNVSSVIALGGNPPITLEPPPANYTAPRQSALQVLDEAFPPKDGVPATSIQSGTMAYFGDLENRPGFPANSSGFAASLPVYAFSVPSDCPQTSTFDVAPTGSSCTMWTVLNATTGSTALITWTLNN